MWSCGSAWYCRESLGGGRGRSGGQTAIAAEGRRSHRPLSGGGRGGDKDLSKMDVNMSCDGLTVNLYPHSLLLLSE